MKKIFTLLAFVCTISANAQTLYFPPTTGTVWDTISPASLGWCQPGIDSLYNFLQTRNTNCFILLKDGKIVLEKYFGSFTQTSTNTWASAGKSLTSMLTGIAQEQGFLNINDTVSNHLGQGWTSGTNSQENQIKIRNLITMTSGLDETPSGSCNNTGTTANCLQYLAAPNTRWAYHTGAYRKMQDVIDSASGLDINTFTDTYIGNHIGMGGSWNNYFRSSNVRDAARFGLLALNKGIWATDTLLHDTAYYNAMINTSQNFNLSYGYLWWLNGKTSYMAPDSQAVFNNTLMSNAPTDMYAALGAGDQKIYVIPSQNMVVVRFGSSAYGSAAAFSPFDNELWAYINSLNCSPLSVSTNSIEETTLIHPNPAQSSFTVSLPNQKFSIDIFDYTGKLIFSETNIYSNTTINSTSFNKGISFVRVHTDKGTETKKLIIH